MIEQEKEPVRRREMLLHVLKGAQEPLSIADLAERLGVHPNTVRFHLGALVTGGQVEQVVAQRNSPGRPPQLFRIALGMDPTGPRQYRLLAEVLADMVASTSDPQAEAIAAGRVWGRRHAEASRGKTAATALSRLIALLDDVGFAPELGEQEQIGLRHCPFLELAQSRSDVVCPVHLGLMQGAMQAWDAPVTVNQLDPFVEPNLCLAHLTPAGAL